MPEVSAELREAYRAFQKKARTNWAELIVSAPAERMKVNGFLVGASNADDDHARRIWQRNQLGVWSTDVHFDMLGLSEGYVCVQGGDSGAVVTYERPEQVITEHDPQRPNTTRAALKVYRDDVEGLDVAYVHVPGLVARVLRPIPVNVDGRENPMVTVAGGWDYASAEIRETGLDSVPIVPFPNYRCLAEFEPHIDLLDRIDWVILQRLVITAAQAFRQRAIKGDLPTIDEAGNPINYAEIFKPGAGALWKLPDSVEMWESAQTSLMDILESVKADLRDLAAVSRTPLPMLMPEGQNQSAEGATFAREGLIFKTQDRLARAGARWSEVMRIALVIEGMPSTTQVETVWSPPELQSLGEKADALSKVGDQIPWRTKMTQIMGFDGDTVDRMAAERAEEMMLASAFAATPTGPTEATPEPPDGDEG
jgi:hypothetical protein